MYLNTKTIYYSTTDDIMTSLALNDVCIEFDGFNISEKIISMFL